MADDEAEKFPRVYAEDALVGNELPLVLSQRCESLFKISDECVTVSGFDDHVIHIGFDILVELLLEAGLDSSLVGAPVFFNPNDIVV
jgi:hypothetical protein